MKKKSFMLRIFVCTVVLCIFGLLFSIITSMVGNPISASIATKKISAYVEETYPEENFTIPKARYNFKDGSYGSFVQSQSSEDTKFGVSVREGNIEDSYVYEVANKFTTYRRLEDALDDAVEVMVAKGFPYETRLVSASMKESEKDAAQVLTLDMPFDLHNIPLPIELTVWTSSEIINYDIIAQRMLELKALMEQQDIAIDRYSLTLEHLYHEENGELIPEIFDSMGVHEFPAEQLVDSPDLPRILEEYEKDRELEGNKEKEAEIQSITSP